MNEPRVPYLRTQLCEVLSQPELGATTDDTTRRREMAQMRGLLPRIYEILNWFEIGGNQIISPRFFGNNVWSV